MSWAFRIILLTVLLASIVMYAHSDYSISGLNESEYTYKAASDSLNNFFENETNIRLSYDQVELGFSFIAQLPKYDQFEAVKELSPDDLGYRWDDRYIQLNLSSLTARVGSFMEYFGSGIVLRSYNDKYYQHDTRLTGLSVQLNNDRYVLKTLYGALPNKDASDKLDVVTGADVSIPLVSTLQVGSSFTYRQIRRFDNNYSSRIVVGGRAEYAYDLFDVYTEYAKSNSYKNIGKDVKGEALYVLINSYLNAFSLTGGYKKYNHFDDYLNDLPTLNSSEEPLSDRYVAGYDEEGLYGQVTYYPNDYSTVELAYSEAWNSDFTIRQSDLLSSVKKELGEIILTIEYAQLEGLDKGQNRWFREMTPALIADFSFLNLPIHLKTEYGINKDADFNSVSKTHKPLLQSDFSFKKLSLSLIAEMEYRNLNSIDNADYWLGVEFLAPLYTHTDLKVFVGKEKGGKVCRNGMCSYTAPFKGLKLNLTTRF
jgi:hypothetical protein